MELTLKFKKMFLISALSHWGRLEIDSRGIFKTGGKWAGERHALFLGR